MPRGHQIFVDALMRFAEDGNDSRLSQITAGIAAPLHIAVLGRDGAGRHTVGVAQTRSGGAVVADAARADVHGLVIAETLKPEDRALLAAADRPIVAVLNKADLTGL